MQTNCTPMDVHTTIVITDRRDAHETVYIDSNGVPPICKTYNNDRRARCNCTPMKTNPTDKTNIEHCNRTMNNRSEREKTPTTHGKMAATRIRIMWSCLFVTGNCRRRFRGVSGGRINKATRTQCNQHNISDARSRINIMTNNGSLPPAIVFYS